MTNHQLINQDSGSTEYYTPSFIIQAARQVMGSIDLDPASSLQANGIVKAYTFFTKETDGLTREWFGNVFMNHPFSTQNNRLWPAKLVAEYRSGRVTQAICITFAATSEKWFQVLQPFPQCYLTPRTNYYLPDGSTKKGVTKGSVVTYMGGDFDRFIDFFSPFGSVKMPIYTAT